MERNIVFGKHPVLRAIQEPKKVEKIFMLQEARGPLEMQVREACKKHNIPLIKTREEKLRGLCGGQNHQGIVATISPIAFQELEDIVPFLFETNKTPFILILDRVSDVGNFGAIARSAEVMGCHAIVIPKKGAAAITKEAIRASTGAIFDIPICRAHNLLTAVDFLKNSGVSIVCTQMNAENTIADTDLKKPVAIIVGSEDSGIHREMFALADNTVKIPQFGKTDSLNVSVASGIIMYEVTRQRNSN